MKKLVVSGLAISAALTAASLTTTPANAQSTTAVYLAARLIGANEVPKAGDKDGGAVAVFRIRGNQVDYAVRWNKITAPTAFHIHQGKAGKNGEVKIPFFGTRLPAGFTAVKGTVTVGDSALLRRITGTPKNWYANLHTQEFGAGAVRAQLYRIRPVNLNTVLAHGSGTTLTSVATGANEVAAGTGKLGAGDRDGRAAWLVWAKGTRVWFATTWSRIGAPTNGHIHRGARGVNGPVVADFFADAKGLPASISGAAGSASAKAAVVQGINRNPKNWYTNLHTKQFPAGAVRGQLHRGAW
ncbi:CHRD domain-containing protein [Nonomuraea typhae]|uniref:CHRD domain-containing protein n=1 Tax=Nonomuraea typhae TaxID=2603600 RepID=UPI0012F7AB62|nr:CHRD domain-containing protein [Nonomuraea typhae]